MVRYGHCATTCSGFSAAGYCGDNTTQSPQEICDTGGVTTYAQDKDQSCSQTCTAFGPYCGDGIVQSTHGEDCDDGNKLDGDSCPATCQYPKYCDYESTEKACSTDDDCSVITFDQGYTVIDKTQTDTVCVKNNALLHSGEQNGKRVAGIRLCTRF